MRLFRSRSSPTPNNEMAIADSKHSKTIFEHIKDFPNRSQLVIAIVNGDNHQVYAPQRNAATWQPGSHQDGLFEIGSVSKVVTSTILAHLVMNKEVKLTDTLSQFIKCPVGDQITLLSLANHTSGLPRSHKSLLGLLFEENFDPQDPFAHFGPEQLEAYFRQLTRLKKPGRHRYSNLGAGTLGYLLGLVTGESYQALVNRYVLTDYGHLENRLIPGIDGKGNPIANWHLNALHGAGGIVTDVQQMIDLVARQFDSYDAAAAMTRRPTHEINDFQSMGLGWIIMRGKNGQNYYFHNGATGGYTSCLTVNTEYRKAVIILSNTCSGGPRSEKLDLLGLKLLKEEMA